MAALRTIALRIRGTSVEVLEEMGEETDGVVENVSKLQEKVKAITGVNILDESGAYKDTYQILKELAEVWDDVGKTDPKGQAALLELLAGKNRSNALAAILGNLEDLDNAYKAALDAEGSAQKELDTYLNSIQGRVDKFTNAVQTMWMNAIQTDDIKGIVDAGTAVVNFIDKIGLLQSALIGLAGFAVLKHFGPSLITSFQGATTAIFTQIAAMKALRAEQVAGTASEAALTAAKQTGATITGEKLFNLMAEQKVTMSDAATNWLAANSETELTRQKILAAVASGELAKADGIAMLATTGLAGSVQTLWEAFLASPLMPIVAALGLLAGAIWVIDATTTSFKEAKEQLAETSQELDNTKDNLKSLNKELETTKERIDELNKKENPTFADKEELKRLQTERSELEAIIELEKQREDRLRKQQSLEAQDVFKRDIEMRSMTMNKMEPNAEGEYTLSDETFTRPAKMQRLINQFDELKAATEEARKEWTKAEEELANANADVNNPNQQKRIQDATKAQAEAEALYNKLDKAKTQAEADIQTYVDEIKELYKNLEWYSGDDLELWQEDSNAMLSEINKFIHSGEIAINNSEKVWNAAFRKINLHPGFQDIIQKLKTGDAAINQELSKVVSVYDENADVWTGGLGATDNTKLQEFLQYLIDSRIIADTSAESIEKLRSAYADLGKQQEKQTVVDKKLERSQKRLRYYELYKDLNKYTQAVRKGEKSVSDLIDTHGDNINAILTEMNALAAEIDAYDILGVELEAAKKAFEDFEEAQKIDTESDRLEDVGNIFTTIVNGFHSAELGSESFKAALAAAVPKSVYKDAKTLKEAYAEIFKYVDTYLNKFITLEFDEDGALKSAEVTNADVERFLKEIEKKGLGTYDEITGIWEIDEMKFSDFAEKMKMTEAIVYALGVQVDKTNAERGLGGISSFFDTFDMGVETNIYNITRQLAALEEQFLSGDISIQAYVATYEKLTAKLNEQNSKALDEVTNYREAEAAVNEYKKQVFAAYEEMERLELNGALPEDMAAQLNKIDELTVLLEAAIEAKKKLIEPSVMVVELAEGTYNKLVTELENKLAVQGLKLPITIDGKINEEYKDYIKQDLETGKYEVTIEPDVKISQEKIDAINESVVLANNNPIKVDLEGEQEARDKLAEIKQQLEEMQGLIEALPDTINIDMTQVLRDLDTLIDKLGIIKTDFSSISVSAAGANPKELEALQEQLDAIFQKLALFIRLYGTDEVIKKLEEIQGEIQEIHSLLQKVPKLRIDGSQAIATAHLIQSEIAQIQDKTVTITTIKRTINENGSGSGGSITSAGTVSVGSVSSGSGDTRRPASGTPEMSGTAHASGSWGLENNEKNALVGELGQETIVDPYTGRYYTVGDNGAELVDIPKGAIIFNHRQTEELFKNGHINSRGKAYVEGNAYGGTILKDYVNEKVYGSSGTGLEDSIAKATSAVSKTDNKFKELFDWFEILTEEMETQISLMEAQLENAVGVDAKKSIYGNLIEAEEIKIDAFNKGIELYTKQANEFLAKIPEKYKDLAQDGGIKIEEFAGDADEKTLEIIKNYREWIQKAKDLNVQLEESKTLISDLRVQTQEMIAEEHDNEISLITHLNDTLEAEMSLLEAKGELSSAKFYEEMIRNSESQLELLGKQRDAMQAELDDAVKSGDVKKYSDDWYEMVNAIYEVDEAIIDSKISMEEYNNSIQELHWDNFEKTIDNISAISDGAEQLRDLIGDDNLTDELVPEQWTADGVTALGLVAQQMENAQQRAKLYGDEIEYLKAEFKKGNYSQDEYNEKLKDLKDSQWDAIEAYESAKDAIIDLNKTRINAIKNGIQKEIDAYEELINKRKEDLDAQKDAHDWANTVEDHTKNIDAIQRQIDAMAGDNSAAAIAKRKQLQEELAVAQEEYDEVLYNRSIETQQQALDKSLETYRQEKEAEIEELDAWLEKEDAVIAESYATISANTEAIHANIEAISDKYGVEIESNIVDPWTAGATALGTYGTELDTATSKYVEMLSGVKQELIDLQLAADNTAESIINATNESSKKTEAAVKDPTKSTSNSNKTSSNKTTSSSSSHSNNYDDDDDDYDDYDYDDYDYSYSTDSSIQVGQTVTVADDASEWARDGGNGTGMADWVPGSEFTVMDTSGDEVLIGIDGVGYTGWIDEDDLVGYAKGTTGVKNDQLAWIDENGLEELVMHAEGGRLTYLTKGSSVIPHDISENLMELGKVDPKTWLENNRKTSVPVSFVTNNNTLDLSFGSLINIEHADRDSIPEIQDAVKKQIDAYIKQINSGLKKFAR